jgi:hypothetical protein
LLRPSEESAFIRGFNGALNLLYRLCGKCNSRLFTQFYYSLSEDSAQLIPGFRLNPWPNVEFSFAAPLALGSKDAYYYKNTVYNGSLNQPLPFAIVFLFTLSGSVQFEHY